MKKIFIVFYLLLATVTFSIDEIHVDYPKNRVDFYFYKDLEKDKYRGGYIDLFDFINQDKKYKFKYSLQKEGKPQSEIQIRKLGKFDSNYNYIETGYIQRVYIIAKQCVLIDELEKKDKINVGYLGKGLEEVEQLKKYKGNIQSEITIFNSEEDIYYALINGKIDVAAITNLKKSSNFPKVDILTALNVKEYVGIRKDREDLYQVFSKGIAEFDNQKLLESNKKNRIEYFKYLYKDTPMYEDIKKRYKEIKIYIPDRDYAPYYKIENEKAVGVLPYITEDIEKFLDIPIKYVFSEDESWDIKGVDFSRDKTTYSRGYLRNRLVGINKIKDSTILSYDNLEGMTLIKLQNTNLNNLLSKVKNKKVIEVESFDEGMKYLKDTKNSVFLGPELFFTYHLKDYRNFKINYSKFEFPTEMTFRDRALIRVLNRILLSYSADEIEYVAKSVAMPEDESSLERLGGSALIGIILVLIVLGLKKYRKKGKD